MFDENTLKQLEANYIMAGQRGPTNNQRQEPKKKKNFLVDQISTAGGILGGIGGSFIAPIAGTAGGAAIGSGLGEAIENIIMGESVGKNVAKEAALGGVFGAGPVRGVKALASGAKALTKDKVAEQTTRTAAQRGAQSLLGSAWGIKTGAKAGSETLTPQSAQKLQQFIAKEVGVPKTASADMVAERLVNFRKLSGQNIDDIVKTSDRTLSPQEIAGLSTSISGKIGSLAGIDTASPIVQRLTQQLGEKKTLSELIQFRRSLDDAVNFARNPASPDPITERLAKAMRSEVDKVTSKLIPGLKTANLQYAQASKALDYVLPAAKNPQGLNILNNKVGGNLAQRGKAAIGQLTGGSRPPVTGSAPQTAPTGRTFAGIAGRVGVAEPITRSTVSSLFGGGQEQPNTLEDALMQTEGVNQTPWLPDGIPGPLDQVTRQPAQANPYTRENLVADMQRDPANAEKYFEYYSMLQEAFAPAPNEKPLSAEASKIVSNAQTGLQALTDFESAIAQDPTVLAKRTIPGRGALGGLLGGALGTRGADAAANQIVDVIARLRTGAAITNDEAKRFEAFIPQASDPENVRQQKLNYLRNQFQMVASRSNGAGSDLESAIMNAQTL